LESKRETLHKKEGPEGGKNPELAGSWKRSKSSVAKDACQWIMEFRETIL
jgi:hypothetical protein